VFQPFIPHRNGNVISLLGIGLNTLLVCESGLDSWLEDGGDLTHKEHLPVKQLRFGDTGSPLDEKEGRYTLGPLMCEGDGMFYCILKVHVKSKAIP
jgi:hypothetical protein